MSLSLQNNEYFPFSTILDPDEMLFSRCHSAKQTPSHGLETELLRSDICKQMNRFWKYIKQRKVRQKILITFTF